MAASALDDAPRTPSPSQRAAIEAEPHSLLVLAGPGAGKTYCLIERINHLIQHRGVDPARICAFTFTNKAAGEITTRLEKRLGGERAEKIQRGTIHAFCADLLRELGASVLLEPDFGIADEEYQLATLRRIEGPRRWHRNTLTRFSAHRFRGDPLMHDDLALFHQYEAFLTDRKLVDFDTLVIKAAELLEQSSADAAAIRQRWDVVLVDEFQDLNPVQYRVIRALARDHRHIFAVGDDEQSIYSWAGADPKVFVSFMNDLALMPELIFLEENRRCPQDVFELARRLVKLNPPIFERKKSPIADRVSTFAVQTLGFDNDDVEEQWIVNDIRRDRELHGHRWGDVALLYRKHDIGNRLESAFLNAGIPCRLAHGRALADDPVVAYVLAASRVIAFPDDVVYRDAFLRVVLPKALFLEAQAESERSQVELRIQLRRKALQLPRKDPGARTIRRALTEWKNLEAVGKQHTTLTGLITELLSRRVGRLRSVLDERHDEISDPATSPEVKQLADRLRAARERRAEVWITPMNGIDIPIKGMLTEVGIRAVRGIPPAGAEYIGPNHCRSIGLPLGVFKAAQLLEMGEISSTFTSFTAFDLETTDRDTAKAEIVEIAAVRVENGEVVKEFHALVKPRAPLTAGAMDIHGITNEELADKPRFEEVWPAFRAFCGNDVIVAHNGYDFDFKIISRMAREIGQKFDLCTFDSLPLSRELVATSNKLQNLARQFGIDAGQSHRALDDTRALAKVLLELNTMKLARARKTALVDLLGHLGVALALSADDDHWQEARLFREMTRPFALGAYSGALDYYEHETGDDTTIPGADEVIGLLGGAELMVKIRTVKSADERYPAAMMRLRRLIAEIPDISMHDQLSLFLERAVLSKLDGLEPDRMRVNLLTLHSTKGLEFSRVYVIGAEDAQLPGGSPSKGPTPEETEEARRLLYVGMTRTINRLVMTRAAERNEKATGGHQFLDEMGLTPGSPS